MLAPSIGYSSPEFVETNVFGLVGNVNLAALVRTLSIINDAVISTCRRSCSGRQWLFAVYEAVIGVESVISRT